MKQNKYCDIKEKQTTPKKTDFSAHQIQEELDWKWTHRPTWIVRIRNISNFWASITIELILSCLRSAFVLLFYCSNLIYRKGEKSQKIHLSDTLSCKIVQKVLFHILCKINSSKSKVLSSNFHLASNLYLYKIYKG